MIKFMRTNLFNLLITFLLSGILAIGVYAASQVEELEGRVWDLEQKGVAINGAVKLVDAKFIERTENMAKQLDRISTQFDGLCKKLDQLLYHLLGETAKTSP